MNRAMVGNKVQGLSSREYGLFQNFLKEHYWGRLKSSNWRDVLFSLGFLLKHGLLHLAGLTN